MAKHSLLAARFVAARQSQNSIFSGARAVATAALN